MPQGLRIIDLFERKIDRDIEEIIKVDQTDEDVVHQELTEYVVTDALRADFKRVLEQYRSAQLKPSGQFGVWVSGFFGSGKSSFAKILGYVLEGRKVKGELSSDAFCRQAADDSIKVLLKVINETNPTTSVILDAATDHGVMSSSELVTELVYKAFLRSLDYSDDIDLAELEIALEDAGELDRFEQLYLMKYGKPWRERRDLVIVAMNQASAILNQMHPETYPQPDSWARTKRKIDISANGFATRAMELMKRRGDGRTLVFVVDEVGQYVARSKDKMLDLQALVEAVSRIGSGRIWVIVTSQERLRDVVSNLDGAPVELGRLIDRFPIQVDLGPQDISEITSKRVLTKRSSYEASLRDLYEQNKGSLGVHTKLHHTSRRCDLDPEQFVQLYPFLPYQIDLLISIASGLRTQGGSMHGGGSNRTLIKLAQQLVINPAVDLGHRDVGALVTLDMVYDLVEGNVIQEKKLEVAEVRRSFGEGSWETKVFKAICLLEVVEGLPREAENLAAVLYPAVGSAPILPDVEAALATLQQAQKIRKGEKGWELLSVEGKRWESERQSIAFGDSELARLKQERVQEVFENLRSYRHLDLRNFAPTLWLSDKKLGKDGDLNLRLTLAGDGEFSGASAEGRESSRRAQEDLVWVSELSRETYNLLRELYRSTTMVNRYSRNIHSAREAQLLGDEKERQESLLRQVKVKLTEDLISGVAFFQGVETKVRVLGGTIGDVVLELLKTAVPKVYHKFDVGAAALKGGEAAALATSANLSGLPAVVWDGPGRLGLVGQQGGSPAVKVDAPLAQEVMDFVQKRYSAQEKVTGKALETYFSASPYGWDLERIMVAAAALFRGAKLEITAQGQRIRTISDPGAKEPFATVPNFRAAGFAPRQGGPGIQMLVEAHKAYQKLFGRDLNLEEGAVAAGVREALSKEKDNLLPLISEMRAKAVPGVSPMENVAQTMKGIVSSPSDDAIRTFAQEAATIGDALTKAKKMRSALDPLNWASIEKARQIRHQAWPVLQSRRLGDQALEDAAMRLAENLEAETWYDRLPALAQDSKTLGDAYIEQYRGTWKARSERYSEAINEVRSLEGFDTLALDAQAQVLRGLEGRLGRDRRAEDITEVVYSPSLPELESDIFAVEGLRNDAVTAATRLLHADPVVKVAVRDFFKPAELDPAEFEHDLDRFKEHCLKLLAGGNRIIFE